MQVNVIGNMIKSKYGGIDIDAKIWLDALSGTITSNFECSANDLFVDMKGGSKANTTNKLPVLQYFDTMMPIPPTILADVLVNAATPGTFNASAVNTPIVALQGIHTNITGYLDSNYNPVTLGKDINSFGFVWDNFKPDINSRNPMGSRISGGNYTSQVYSAGNYLAGVGQGNDNVATVAPQAKVGIVVAESNTLLSCYNAGILVGTGNRPATSFFNGNIEYLGSNNNGVAGGFPDNGHFHRFFGILNSKITANEARDMTDAINNYQLKNLRV